MRVLKGVMAAVLFAAVVACGGPTEPNQGQGTGVGFPGGGTGMEGVNCVVLEDMILHPSDPLYSGFGFDAHEIFNRAVVEYARRCADSGSARK